jgi:phosphatidylglycerophosphate synthase
MSIRSNLANVVSICRMFSAILFIAFYIQNQKNEYILLCYAIGAATDFMDGFIARELSISSRIGHKIDISADYVCFAIAPLVFSFYHSVPLFFIGGLLCIYGIARIRTSEWICHGLPLPLTALPFFLILLLLT